MRSPHRFLQVLVSLTVLLAATTARGQVQNVTGDVATPIPGVGHDYIHFLSETVNPATGSLSIRIDLPTPRGRGLTLPFALLYNSSGVNQPMFDPNTSQASWYNLSSQPTGVGWSNSIPNLTALEGQSAFFNQSAQPPVTYTCTWISNYVLQAMDASRHLLNISIAQTNEGGTGCGNQIPPPNNSFYGGDAFFSAATSFTGTIPDRPTPVTVAGLDGTVYSFSQFGSFHSTPVFSDPQTGLSYYAMASSIEDRNGNILQIGSSNNATTVTDSVGRTVLSISAINSGTNTITVSGFPNPYTLQWATANSSFSTGQTYVGAPQNASNCNGHGISGQSLASTVIQSVTLPNGETYRFDYGSNPYGLVDKITYPSGGYVAYTWGENQLSDQFSWPVAIPGVNGLICTYDHGSPAIVKRIVSFDGINQALEQDFSYSTTWPSNGLNWTNKQTIVTTKDCTRSPSCDAAPGFQTVYSYLPFFVPSPPNSSSGGPTPIEQTVTYKDISGATLKTDTKGWLDQFSLACQLETLATGVISGTFYSYVPSRALLTDKKEYDYGLITSTSACQNGSSAPSGITPTRETAMSYQSFGITPIFPAATSILDRPASVKVYANGASGTLVAETDYIYSASTVCAGSPACITPVNHDETNYSASSTAPRGNATTVTRKCLQSCADSVTTYSYDETGQVISVTDACGNTACSDMNGSNHTTTYSYADSFASGTGTPQGQTNAYLTQVTYPNTGVAHVENFTWGYADGLIRTHKDQNNQVTSYIYNTPPAGCGFPDSLNRLSEIDFPDSGKTTFCYNDSAPSPSLTTSQKIDTGGRLLTSVNVMDGLGHVVKTQLCEDGSACTQLITTDSTFDGLSRVWKRSNPHRAAASSTDGTTIFTYDALGRTTQVTQPDGSAVNTSYSGPCTTVTEEAGNSRKSCSDGLGHLTQVVEDPGASPHLNYATSYSYDTLDNLTSVLQNGSRQRTFSYDSLSRLLSATNPESGAVSYAYDANGNLASKTSPAPNQTGSTTVTLSYCYDPLNRMASKAYTNQSCPMSSPVATYRYDTASLDGHALTNPVGRLVKNATADGKSATWNSYDQVGRTVNQWQCSPLNCGATPYAKTFVYDFLGDHASDTYSYTTGTLTISYSYDNAARPLQVTSNLVDSQHPATLATVDSSFGYWPNGAIRKITLGNGLTETAAFNNRLQPCRMNVNSTGAYFAQCTDAVPGGNVLDFSYGFNAGTADNGNVASWSATGQQTFSRTYSYDSLNRIASMSSPSDPTGCTGLSWTIDPWGNRTDQAVTGGTCNTFHQAVDANNRFIAPYQYDAAGNMTHDASHSYSFDAENRVTQVDGGSTASYVYDASGRRVWKSVGGTTTDYLYDLSDHIFAIFGPGCTSGCWTAGAEYLNGHFLAEYANGTTYFVHKDHLGSSRLLTGLDQSVCDNYDYLPYGEQLTGGNCTILRFTGKEHDSESGLDNFGARLDSSSMGRFISPDPFYNDSHPGDPQSWNEYAYARNNPLRYVDPSGRKADVSTSCTTDQQNHTTCDVTVTATITIYSANGANLSQDQLNAAASTIQSSINNAWSGSFQQEGVTYNVSTQVSVQAAESLDAAIQSGAQNVIGITQGMAIPGSANSFVNPRSLFSSDSSPDTGLWSLTMGGGLGPQSAHEFGHLIGLGESGDPANLMDSALGQLMHTNNVHATQADLQSAFGVLAPLQRAGGGFPPLTASNPQTVFAPDTIQTKVNVLWQLLTHKY